MTPQIGEKYEKDGITIEVHHISESQVYCGRSNGSAADLVRVPIEEWEQKIAGAKRL